MSKQKTAYLGGREVQSSFGYATSDAILGFHFRENNNMLVDTKLAVMFGRVP